MAAGFGDLSKRIDLLAREMGGKGQQARLKRVGVLSKTDVNAAVRADLGDLSMSGWRRGNPHEITGRFDLAGDSAVVMSPSKRGRGPMRVLEQGRNVMFGPGISAAGTTARNKNGTVKRARKFRRANGTTQGKDTWTDATEIMTREMPKRYAAELDATIGKFITGRG